MELHTPPHNPAAPPVSLISGRLSVGPGWPGCGGGQQRRSNYFLPLDGWTPTLLSLHSAAAPGSGYKHNVYFGSL